MNESNLELDSFTADMLRRVKEHKAQLDKLLTDDDNDDEGVSSQNGSEHKEENTSEKDQEHQEEESNFDELHLDDNDNYKAHVRKSISALLNVRESLVFPESEDELELKANEKPASRLHRRLDRLTTLYSDSEVKKPNVLTEHEVNINENAVDAPKPRLKDRLNDIARFYYPIQETSTTPIISQKPSTPGKSTHVSELEVYAKSESPVIQSKHKVINIVQRFNSQEIVQQKQSLSDLNQSSSSSSIINKMPEEVLQKKPSVADLKQIFEGKSQEEPQHPREVAPELLSLRDKKRLFEKAIRNENEASRNQYRKLPQPKRIANWESILQEETEAKRPRNIASPPAQSSMPLFVGQEHSDEQTSQDEGSGASDIDDQLVNQQSLSVGDEHKMAEVSVQDSIEKAFETIDNYSMSDSEGSNIDTIANITFSPLDSTEQLQRSSTKVNLKSDSQSSVSSSQPSSSSTGLAGKAAQLYMYENDEPDDANSAPTSDDPPPLRTISFYRKEQKMRKEICDSPIPGTAGVIRIEQKSQEDQSHKLEEFKRTCLDKISSLKNEVSEHNRISGQASTALNMCLTHHDLEYSEGRIEAERLLLIADEKRKACLAEIYRLKNMLMDPVKYLSQQSAMSSKGLVSISKLRVPLRNEFVDLHSKGKSPSTVYFICLVFNGPNVFVSDLVNTADNVICGYLDFKFTLHCQELLEDFAVRVQLFSLELNKVKPKKEIMSLKKFRLKYITSSLKGLDKNPVSSPIPHKITSQLTSFESVGHITLNLSTARKPPSIYSMESLQMNTPVDGYIIMDVALRVKHNISTEGYFDLQESATPYWNTRWFVLQGDQLFYWRFAEDVKDKQPLGIINLKNCINPRVAFLKGDQRKVCMRPYTFPLVTIKPPPVSNAHKLVNGGKIVQNAPQKYFISSQSQENSQALCEQIAKALRNIRVWEQQAVPPYSAEEFNRLLLHNHS